MKILQPTNEVFIQFTEEELEKLNIKAGDKFIPVLKDGGVLLERTVPIEIELDSLSDEIKSMLILKSIEDQLPVDEVIVNIIKQCIDLYEN